MRRLMVGCQGVVDTKVKFYAVDFSLIQDLVAREIAMVSSSIWNRVILPSETVRISAKGESMVLSAVLTPTLSTPIKNRRSSPAKISWASKRICSIK
jgi:hypothetical protein